MVYEYAYEQASLTVFVPSRNRPESITRLKAAFTGHPQAKLVVIVDADEPKMYEYMSEYGPHTVLVAPRGRPGIVDPLNWAVSKVPKTEFIGFLGDDFDPQSPPGGPTWDSAVCEALRGLKTGLCYGRDGIQNEKLPTAIFMTWDIVDTLGYMAPVELKHLFLDNWWLELGQGADCIEYLPHVDLPHLHPIAGLAEWDETYERTNNQDSARGDRLAFEKYKRDGKLDLDIAKVKELRRARGLD